MLGGLARWLRFAGFDTTLPVHVDQRELLQTARAEGRWLLTRDRKLAARSGPRVLCIRALLVPEQLAEVGRRLRLRVDPLRYFTRCSRCNGHLVPLEREQAHSLVPPFVATHASEFSQCQACGHVYWPGSHHGRIRVRLEGCFAVELVDGGEDDGEA
jgi:uncharacterized protein with PIN domain